MVCRPADLRGIELVYEPRMQGLKITPTVIPLTDEQLGALTSLFQSLEYGGMILAQIYPDGMRVLPFGAEQAKVIYQAVTGKEEITLRKSAYAPDSDCEGMHECK